MAIDNFIDELRETIARSLVDAFRVDERTALRFAYGITRELMRRFGGSRIYLPKVEKADQREQILALFNGANHAEVCRKLNISRSTLYRTIKPTKT